jgi:hypothetical protein
VFCERCGLNFLPRQSVCTRCKVSATRHWFQLMSLVTLMVAVACNALVALIFLPRLAAGTHARAIFRAWLWFDDKFAMYGWVPASIALLAWDFLVWKEARPKVKGWFTRKLLTFSLAAGVGAGRSATGTVPRDDRQISGSARGVGMAVVLVVVALLCCDAESRDYLLGHGKTLSVVSIGALVAVLAMTIAGWSITY